MPGRQPTEAGSSRQERTIPVLHVGRDFARETALAVGERGYDLLEQATAGIPAMAIRLGDALSRAWLARVRHPYLGEIDDVARLVARPGTHFFNVHYEWGCTTAAWPVVGGTGYRLVRVLDWKTPGLGRHAVAACVNGAAGPWVTLTWPGYTGVLQAMAKGRFAAALNQAPARAERGQAVLDWVSAKRRIWLSRAITPAHLLRQVLEQAGSFAEARDRLIRTPLSSPVIYTLAGVRPGEAAVIERREEEAHVVEGPAGAACANDWQAPAWSERRRPGRWSGERLAAMARVARAPNFAAPFAWLAPPMLNEESRLAILADPVEGRLMAQGYEADGAATAVLDLRI